jgi:micrococcal nuclease
MPKNTNKYHAEVVRVIDGDTFEMMIELGFGVTQKFSVRLDGIDTPEVSTIKGRQVKEFVRNLIEGKSVLVTDEGAEKYGRARASIELADGKDLTEYLIESKIGVEYHGGKKQSLVALSII